jgi:hypothetical protein
MAPHNDGPAEGIGSKEAPPTVPVEDATPTESSSSMMAGDTKKRENDDTDDSRRSPQKSPAKKQKTKQEVDDMSWICGECHEAECMLEPSADFLLCDGSCFRVFHHPCVGISQLPETDDDWLCKDCTVRRHQCAFCHDYGEDDVDVFSCRRSRCGLYFHESCLEMHNVEVTTTTTTTTTTTLSTADDTKESDSGDAEAETTSAPVFSCPAHNCWTCTQKDLQKEEQKLELEKSKNTKRKKGKKKKKQQSTFQCKSEPRLFVSTTANYNLPDLLFSFLM